jgi:uncharacterized membrane protein
MKKTTFISDISGIEFPIFERVNAASIRESMMRQIQKDNPNFNENSNLSIKELNQYRENYISDFLGKQLKELTVLEKTVLESVTDKTTISDKVEDEEKTVSTFGQKLADHVAAFGGSWTFILFFVFFIVVWISTNVFWMTNKGFDPYPFILLNLILSCIAAMQAPVIMMSQNRQEEKDRERAKKDYMINLKSELEIRMLHEKIDHLIIHQQQELLEIQKVQIDMMNDIMTKLDK